jgi:hypothetical protein
MSLSTSNQEVTPTQEILTLTNREHSKNLPIQLPIDPIAFAKTYFAGIKIGLASGLSQNEANISANSYAQSFFGYSLHDLNNTAGNYISKPISNEVVVTLVIEKPKFITATEFAKRIATVTSGDIYKHQLNSREVNKLFLEAGFITGEAMKWQLTDAGMKWGEYSGGSQGMNGQRSIKWNEDLAKYFVDRGLVVWLTYEDGMVY